MYTQIYTCINITHTLSSEIVVVHLFTAESTKKKHKREFDATRIILTQNTDNFGI